MNEWTWQFQRGGEENASLVSFKFHSLCCCSVHVKRKINLHKLIRWIKRLLMLLQHLMVLSLCLSSHNLPFPSSHLNPFTTNWKLVPAEEENKGPKCTPSSEATAQLCSIHELFCHNSTTSQLAILTASLCCAIVPKMWYWWSMGLSLP